ncbi:type IV secretion system protein, partial [Escherichia coli]|uniref:type IV secretion system protein n=1 Tax=Escherichia coli TaxID=562 RepID=UPI0013B3FB68
LSTEAFGEIISRLIKVGVVAWLALNADNFLQWVGTPLLETLPQGITRAIAAATGGSADPDVNAFDALLRNGIAAGM